MPEGAQQEARRPPREAASLERGVRAARPILGQETPPAGRSHARYTERVCLVLVNIILKLKVRFFKMWFILSDHWLIVQNSNFVQKSNVGILTFILLTA